MYKVFFNDRMIYLDDTIPDMSKIGEDYICAFENITDLKPQVRQFLAPDKTGNLHIFHDDQDSLLGTFKQCFKNISAGGGLVRNSKDEILLIFRRRKWDLPKGKAEEGETSEQTALREVEEECGLGGIEIREYLQSTFHIYEENNEFILKQTDWYSMFYHGSSKPIPEFKEDITEVRWISSSGMPEIFKNTWPSLIDLFEKAW